MSSEASISSIWTEPISPATPAQPPAKSSTAVVHAESELKAIDELMAELNEIEKIRQKAVI